MDFSQKNFQQNQPTQKQSKGKGALEYGPLILFFITNYTAGIIWGTAVLVISTIVALVLSWVLYRNIPKMAFFGAIAVTFFGGLTLYFDNELFIKIKPTVISLIIAVILTGGQLISRNPLKALLGSKLHLSPAGWVQVTWIWIAMFCVVAIANEIAWRHLTTDGWVTFKVFGLTGISLIFAMISVPIINRHGQISK